MAVWEYKEVLPYCFSVRCLFKSVRVGVTGRVGIPVLHLLSRCRPGQIWGPRPSLEELASLPFLSCDTEGMVVSSVSHGDSTRPSADQLQVTCFLQFCPHYPPPLLVIPRLLAIDLCSGLCVLDGPRHGQIGEGFIMRYTQ